MRTGARWGSGILASTLVVTMVLTRCEGPRASDDDVAAGSSAATAAPVDLRAPEFSAEAAFAHLRRQVEFGPRVPGTEGHRAQLAWMLSWLEERADTVEALPFEHTRPDGRSVALTNVLARFRPGSPDRILLLAHWDTRPTADEEPDPADRRKPIPGANDGASGTAVLLELADVLSRHSPPIGVDLLFVDGEDLAPGEMYLGAAHFAANLPSGYQPMYGVLLDMVGDADPRFPVEGASYRYAPEVVSRVWGVAERLGYGDRFPRRVGPEVTDDHIPLNRAGIPTIDIIDFDYGPGNRYWHTLEDSLENVSPEGLGLVGRVLTTLIFSGG